MDDASQNKYFNVKAECEAAGGGSCVLVNGRIGAAEMLACS